METISQLIRKVSGLKGQLAELTARAETCVCWVEYEGEKSMGPDFDFNEVKKELDDVRIQLVEAKTRLAVANAKTMIVYEGKTIPLIGAITMLQELKGEIAFLDKLNVKVGTTTNKNREFDNDGRAITISQVVHYKSIFSPREKVKMLEKLRKDFSVLNNIIEGANNSTSV